MNVPKLPFLEKKSKTEYFLSLVLRDEKASAVVFEEANGKINVVGEHEEPFKSSLTDATEEELLTVIDRAVSSAEKNLPEGVESQKTIFGLKEDWITDGKINPEYLVKLKKISDELEFKPVGFLVISEAIAHLLQKQEGAPVSAILVEIGKKSIAVSVIKAGRLIETKSTVTGESATSTVDNLLKHLSSSDVLPSRIILFDGGSDLLAQQFISHKWSSSIPFLHVPQVMSLPANFDARAVLAGAATQMGFEVLGNSLNKAIAEDKEEVKPLDQVAEKTEGDKTLGELVGAEDFGFIEGDVKDKEIPKTAVEDIDNKTFAAISDNLEDPTMADKFREIPDEIKVNSGDTNQLPVKEAGMESFITGAFRRLNLKKIFHFVKGSPRKFLLLLLPIALLILIFYVYFFARSATVTISTNIKEAKTSENVTFSEKDPTSAAENVVKVEFVKITQDGKTSTPTTGKKETGDKAKGTVTVFNNSAIGLTLAAGTIITSSNDLKFVTEKAVTVASASGDIFSGTDPGKANVGVTAEKFGTNYNFPSNTKFSVEGNSSIAAKNDSAFSGGTKKDIKVVAQKDLDKLIKDLQKEKQEIAEQEIKNKVGKDSVLLPGAITTTFEKKSFSKKLDEEASEVSLTAVIAYQGVSYKKSDVAEFAKEKLKKEITNGLKLNEENIELSVRNVEEDKKGLSGEVEIKARLIPEIDEGKIAEEIKGKSVLGATSQLSEVPEVSSINIDLSLSLPFLPKRLPFSGSKIKIVVKNNG